MEGLGTLGVGKRGGERVGVPAEVSDTRKGMHRCHWYAAAVVVTKAQ